MKRLIDETAERRLLGILLTRPTLWDRVADRFSPLLFTDETRQAVAQAIIDQSRSPHGLSITRIYSRLRAEGQIKADDMLEMADSVVTSEEFDALASVLVDLASRRAIVNEMREGMANLVNLDRPVNDIMGEIQGRMIQAASTLGHDGGQTWDDLLAANFEELTKRREGTAEPAWPVGLTELAKHLKGIRRKHLIVVAGRPSMGKTSFAQFWMTYLARRGVGVYVFCPDQDPEEIVERELWNLSGINGQIWERPDRWSENQTRVVNEAFSKAHGLPIKLNGRRGMSQDEVCAIARKEKAANPDLGVIVIDHLTALRLTGDKRLSWTKVVGEATKTFKNIAEELDVAVVLLAQLNRSLESREDKRPIMADLRDSGEIEEHANEILFLYREEYYKPDKPGVENVCEIHVAKQKQGPRGETAFVKFEPELARFSDLSPRELTEYVNAISQEHASRRGARP